jgi:putative addiction module component (TIGR02574 family)
MDNPTPPSQSRPDCAKITNMALPAIPAGFDDLSADEKIEYIQGLWARVVAHPEEVPAEDWQQELVTERLTAYRSGKTTTRPWREVQHDLRSSLRPPRR